MGSSSDMVFGFVVHRFQGWAVGRARSLVEIVRENLCCDDDARPMGQSFELKDWLHHPLLPFPTSGAFEEHALRTWFRKSRCIGTEKLPKIFGNLNHALNRHVDIDTS